MSGNLVANPELRFTNSGAEVVKIRVACQDRYQDPQTKEWKNGDSCFLDVEVWRDQANNIVESLETGARVSVTGSLRQRPYETREGEKRSVYEVINAEVSVSLMGQTARVTRVRNGQPVATGGTQATPAAAPAAQAAQAAPAPAAPAAAAAPAAGVVGLLDEPPF